MHAVDAVVDVGVDGVHAFEWLGGGAEHHGIVGRPIDIGERLEKRFRVAAREPASGLSRVVHKRRVWIAGIEAMGLAVSANDHHVRLFLPPLQRALGAVDFNEQIVLAAMADLRRGHRSQGAVVEADHGRAVIVERPAGLERLQVRADIGWNQAGHVACQVVRMGRDIAEASRRAALRGIGPPRRLLLFAQLQPRAQPTLDVAGADRVDLAQFAVEDHLPSLPH